MMYFWNYKYCKLENNPKDQNEFPHLPKFIIGNLKHSFWSNNNIWNNNIQYTNNTLYSPENKSKIKA